MLTHGISAVDQASRIKCVRMRHGPAAPVTKPKSHYLAVFSVYLSHGAVPFASANFTFANLTARVHSACGNDFIRKKSRIRLVSLERIKTKRVAERSVS